MSVRFSVLVRVALHAIPALFAESAIALLAYSSISGRDGARVVGMYITVSALLACWRRELVPCLPPANKTLNNMMR